LHYIFIIKTKELKELILIYLKLNYIIEKEYKLLQINTPNEDDSPELIKKHTIEYLHSLRV
jgi:hypothetical protein